MAKIKAPKALKSRLKEAAARHGYKNGDELARSLTRRGLKSLGVKVDPKNLYNQVVEESGKAGYSSPEELIEHLVEKGLTAYEAPDTDPAKLEERLRGLGYIE